MSEIRERLSGEMARALLEIKAVTLSPGKPYKWASGRLSPVYCDNRLTMAHPSVRAMITVGFETIMRRQELNCDGVVGTATAGIPHAAWLADRLRLPMGYVRSKPKKHGQGNQIEGFQENGAKVVVIEDLVSTGMSSTAVIQPLSQAGMTVKAILAIFTYGLEAADHAFQKAGVPLFTLTSFPELIEEASENGLLSSDELQSLESWYKAPGKWSADRGGAA